MAIQKTNETFGNSVKASSITFAGDNLRIQVYNLLLKEYDEQLTIGEIQSMLGTIENSGSGWTAQMTMIMPQTEDIEVVIDNLMACGLIKLASYMVGEEWNRYQACTPFEIVQRKLEVAQKKLLIKS